MDIVQKSRVFPTPLKAFAKRLQKRCVGVAFLWIIYRKIKPAKNSFLDEFRVNNETIKCFFFLSDMNFKSWKIKIQNAFVDKQQNEAYSGKEIAQNGSCFLLIMYSVHDERLGRVVKIKIK